MPFINTIEQYADFDFDSYFASVTDKMVLQTLAKSTGGTDLSGAAGLTSTDSAGGAHSLTTQDFLNLLSPQATKHLEPMAQRAHILTKQRFGRAMQLYIPLYISNYCTNQCVYCGFNTKNSIHRRHLTLEEIEVEAQAVAKTGIQHILVLTGESEKLATFEYIAQAVKILKRHFASVSIEVYPLSTEQYQKLQELGVDGLTMYQETYNRQVYKEVHPKGRKSDYLWRLNTPERGAKAGIRSINIGPLFGLETVRKEAFFSGLHANYLMRNYPASEVSLSLPRINPAEGGFEPAMPLDDPTFVQFMLTYRIFLPEVGINVSTRESARFREQILPLGVTKMSIGSKTTVGGYADAKGSTAQFEISDTREISDFVHMLHQKGYQAVYKDWEPII